MAEISGGGKGDMPTESNQSSSHPHRILRTDQLPCVEPFLCQLTQVTFGLLYSGIRATTLFGLISTDPGCDFSSAFPGSWN